MDIHSAIRTRRAVRDFTGQPIPDDVLRGILNAGRLAGSAKNKQPWRFIAVRDRDTLQALSECGTYAGHLAGAAVGVAIVTPDPALRWSMMFDAGRAAQNMVLQAWEHGIGSVMATIYEPERARELLKFPDDWHIRVAISFGYPAQDPTARPPRKGGRHTLEEVVHWDAW